MSVLGIDIGTGSTKAVIVGRDGRIIAQASRAHDTQTPHAGWFEQDADAVWWGDIVALCRDLNVDEAVEAVSVSGLGPAFVVTDAESRPLRPAILYGIDTRAEAEIEAQTGRIGADRLIEVVGNGLSSQSISPKIEWIANNEPDVWAAARRIYWANSWVVWNLTGEYVLDHYTAGASDALYDLRAREWWDEGWAGFDTLERPGIAWPGEIVGRVTAAASALTGLAEGTPVLPGTIDATAEAYSVRSHHPGDTMLMYGSTMFIEQVTSDPHPDPRLWAVTGINADTYTLAAGMATAGLITNWLVELTGSSHEELSSEAAGVPAGSGGLLMLPYFAGERTPILDPNARGGWLGLTTRHTRGHLYRSILEAVGYGIRHNLETMAATGAPDPRLIAVGGGAQDRLWTQIVSDITGLPQHVPDVTVGASYGDAMLAAEALGWDTSEWNTSGREVRPDADATPVYDALYADYLAFYEGTRDIAHRLAALDEAGS